MPTPEHLAEFPDMAKYIHGMPGGRDNPMGARALYLYQGDVDTVIRIHGAVKLTLIGKDHRRLHQPDQYRYHPSL